MGFRRLRCGRQSIGFMVPVHVDRRATHTGKKNAIFDLIIEYACDLQLILTLRNHAMIHQYIKNYVMILQ